MGHNHGHVLIQPQASGADGLTPISLLSDCQRQVKSSKENKMLYREGENNWGKTVYLMTLQEVWKHVYKKDPKMTLIDVKKKLDAEGITTDWFGEKGERYYFIYRDKFGRFSFWAD